MTIFFKQITSVVQTDEDFFQTDNLSQSNGLRFYSNGRPQPLKRMKTFLEQIAAAVQMARNFSEWMIQSV